ncbi:MAG: sulfatase, partial [Spirochaetales bacterium]|nr:sulfatase [Spirochaetales bacterium]
MRLLYLDLDTLRPDHLGCYGYQRNTSPNIDRIAREGVRYDNYYCSDAPCLPSRTAMMTGMHGIHTGVVGHGGTTADLRIEGAGRGFADMLRTHSLPALLRSRGLRTTLISPFAERHASWGFYAGFNEMFNTGKGGIESAEEVTPTVLDWITRKGGDDDWYLHINYWDPHTPYRAPQDFGNPFADEPLPEWLTDEVVASHQSLSGPHTALDIMMYNGDDDPQFPRHPGTVENRDGLRRMIDGYDCGIRYMDEHLGRIFDALEQKGVMDDLAVVISSDHGENMGELGIYGEHGTADHATCRIPMIVRWPGGMKGHVDTQLHYNLDFLPTLSELLEADASEEASRWDGESFASSITGGAESGREYLVLSQCAHVAQRSVRFGPWLYMRTYHDGFHPHYEREMLFNIDEDCHETRNMA